MQQIKFENMELDVVSEIKNDIVEQIGDIIYAPHIKVIQNKSNIISINAKKRLVCHIKLKGKTKYIEFKSEYASLFPHDSLESTSENFLRYAISDLSDVKKKYSEIVKMFAGELKKQREDVFGCCSRYIECSNAKKCLHPNWFRSLSCEYKSHLESGEIFYGRNKNC